MSALLDLGLQDDATLILLLHEAGFARTTAACPNRP